MRTKLTHIILLWLIAFTYTSAQNKKLHKANKNFKHFEFAKAISQYERLVAKGNNSLKIYQSLGDANYLNANYVEAAKWYAKIAETNSNSFDVEHMYRYANSLRSVGKYKDSYTILKQLHELHESAKQKSPKETLKAIEKQFGSFSIKHVNLNSTFSDFAPSFRLDGLVFSSGRDTSGISRNIHTWNNKRFLNLYTATNTHDKGFQKIMRFSDNLNSKLHESSTAFTKDGMTVYFTRNKTKRKKIHRDDKGISRLKLYRAVFKDGKWKNVEELSFNKEGYSTAHPTLNKAEDKLYFASDIEGTIGQSDIFVVDIHADGSFGIPKNLGKNINTGGRETFPYVTDDDILYFASDGHLGLGGLDIFVVDLKNLETSKIVNLGEPLNSTADDFSFIINSKTKKGYFASNRDGGMGDDDIYALTEVKPIDMRCFLNLSGMVRNKETDEVIPNSKVTILDKNGKPIAETRSNKRGEFLLEAECNQKDFVIIATKESFEADRKTVSTSDENTSNIILLLTNIDLGAPIGTDLAKYLNSKPIYFDLDKSKIREDAKVILENILAYMNKYPHAKVEVRSHTDSRASSTYNKNLSERRAKETVEYLLSKGIPIERIHGVGYGESQLTNECNDTTKCSEAKHQQNRRSEFIIFER